MLNSGFPFFLPEVKKMTMKFQGEKSEVPGRNSYSKWGMQDVSMYAQIPFILPEATTGHSPAFES